MSGEAVEADKNRKQRRARQSPSLTAQRFASLCFQVSKANPPQQEEPADEYLLRIRNLAARVQHEQRKSKRSTARAARKRNR